jgi:hypothetical protein
MGINGTKIVKGGGIAKRLLRQSRQVVWDLSEILDLVISPLAIFITLKVLTNFQLF